MSTGPGLTQWVRMPLPIASSAVVSGRTATAALQAAWAPVSGRLRCRPVLEAMLKMVATLPWRSMAPILCSRHSQVPSVRTSSISLKVSTSNS